MAGPSIGTWVKVKNKSGRLTARVMANKFGGGSYEQGQVITQSEYNSYKEKRAEAIAGEGKNKATATAKKTRGESAGESALRKLQSKIKNTDDFLDNKIEELSFDNLVSGFSRKEINALSGEVAIAMASVKRVESRTEVRGIGGAESVKADRIRGNEIKSLALKLEKMDRLDGRSLAKNLSTRDLTYLSNAIGGANRFGTKAQPNRKAPKGMELAIEAKALDRKLFRQMGKKDGLSVSNLAKTFSPRQLALLSSDVSRALTDSKSSDAVQRKGKALPSARKKLQKLLSTTQKDKMENVSFNDLSAALSPAELRAVSSQVMLAMDRQTSRRR